MYLRPASWAWATQASRVSRPVAVVHGGGGVDNVATASLHVVIRPDTYGRDAALRPDHMLHRRKKFRGQSPMGDDNQANHENFTRIPP